MSAVSQLDELIQPEIRTGRFARVLEMLAAEPGIGTILEIGSSAGAGSTSALLRGARRNPGKPTLFCVELSVPRFEALRRRYGDDPQVRCYNTSSVPIEALATEQQVTHFYRAYRPKLLRAALALQLQWLAQDAEYLLRSQGGDWGIRRIRAEHNIDRFDLVLIDGSEFTGAADLDEVYGARIIALDDTLTFKNHENYLRLRADPAYEQLCSSRWSRNGFAVFRRRVPWVAA